MSLLRLRLEVKGTEILREIAVLENFTLAFLHVAIQDVFGWLDYHLHEFTDAKGVRYGDPDAPPDDDECAFKSENEVMMKRPLKKPGDTLDYAYDFGDDNHVKITLLGRTTLAQRAHFASKGSDLIEDSAGFGGTEGIVNILRGNDLNGSHEDQRYGVSSKIDSNCHLPSGWINEIMAGVVFVAREVSVMGYVYLGTEPSARWQKVWLVLRHSNYVCGRACGSSCRWIVRNRGKGNQ